MRRLKNTTTAVTCAFVAAGFAGCGTGASSDELHTDVADASREATVVDAASVPVVEGGAPASTGCDEASLRFSRTEAETNAAAMSLLTSIRAHGAPNASFKEVPAGTGATLIVTQLGQELNVPASADPRAALVAWLEALDPARQGEYVPDARRPNDPGTVAVNDVFLTALQRTTIGGLAFPGGRDGVESVLFVVAKRAAGWRLDSVSLAPEHVLATRDDAELQARCHPTAPPPEAPLRASVWKGPELIACAPSGDYAYTPAAADRFTWASPITWIVDTRATPGDADRRPWNASRTGTLTIDPTSYWPTVARADCYCGSEAGFRLTVDAWSGALLRSSPGISCVVC